MNWSSTYEVWYKSTSDAQWRRLSVEPLGDAMQNLHWLTFRDWCCDVALVPRGTRPPKNGVTNATVEQRPS